MKDTNLLPHILPNVFSISNDLSATQFASMVLPSLRPLFSVKEPPQNMLTLLDNLSMLQNKTEKAVFRERECANNPNYTVCHNAAQRYFHLFTTHWNQNMQR